jgi:uncharacterized protein YciI
MALDPRFRADERNIEPISRGCEARYTARRSTSPGSAAMLFVIHAIDRNDAMPTRAKFYRDHRIHLDRAGDHHVDVATAGTLIADDGETPCGSVFVIDAKDRATVDAFVRSDPYHVNDVWERVEIHGYSKKRGTPIVSRRGA